MLNYSVAELRLFIIIEVWLYSLQQSYNQTSRCKRCIYLNAYEFLKYFVFLPYLIGEFSPFGPSNFICGGEYLKIQKTTNSQFFVYELVGVILWYLLNVPKKNLKQIFCNYLRFTLFLLINYKTFSSIDIILPKSNHLVSIV